MKNSALIMVYFKNQCVTINGKPSESGLSVFLLSSIFRCFYIQRLPSEKNFGDDTMKEETRMPQNGKEFILFLAVISIISVNTIAPLIMALQFGFTKAVYLQTLKTIPFMWIIVVLIVPFIVEPIVNKLMPKFIQPTDSFNAATLFHIFFSVLIMSILLTVIGTWVGTKTISMEPIKTFFYTWPRNFTIAFFIELLVAQPLACLAMALIHKQRANKTVNS